MIPQICRLIRHLVSKWRVLMNLRRWISKGPKRSLSFNLLKVTILWHTHTTASYAASNKPLQWIAAKVDNLKTSTQPDSVGNIANVYKNNGQSWSFVMERNNIGQCKKTVHIISRVLISNRLGLWVRGWHKLLSLKAQCRCNTRQKAIFLTSEHHTSNASTKFRVASLQIEKFRVFPNFSRRHCRKCWNFINPNSPRTSRMKNESTVRIKCR